MARGVNKVILVGNLGNDPETKYTQGGMCVCSISLATSSVRKDREGNTQERVDWHRVKLFGKLGEVAAEYLRKGAQVYIEGSIRYSEHTGDDGVKRYYTDIMADEMQMLGGRGGGGGLTGQHAENAENPGNHAGGGGSRQQRPQQSRAPSGAQSRPAQTSAPPVDDFSDDDIPF